MIPASYYLSFAQSVPSENRPKGSFLSRCIERVKRCFRGENNLPAVGASQQPVAPMAERVVERAPKSPVVVLGGEVPRSTLGPVVVLGGEVPRSTLGPVVVLGAVAPGKRVDEENSSIVTLLGNIHGEMGEDDVPQIGESGVEETVGEVDHEPFVDQEDQIEGAVS